MINLIRISVVLIIFNFSFQSIYFVQGQTHVNRNWIETINEPLELDWSKSIVGANQKVIHVGNTIESGEGANISITLFNSDGTINWQNDFHTSSDYNDYGISVVQDSEKDIYVLGTTDNGTTNNYDILLLKYSTTGNLLWSEIINSSYDLNDIGTELILGKNEEFIYICASSESSFENFDLLTLKFDIDGDFIWNRRYDYDSFVEIPTGIKLDKENKLYVTTASGSSTDQWDYTTVRYDLNGDYLGDNRHAMQGIGFDQPLDFTQDTTGNIYITGRASSTGTNYDIRTIKLDDEHNLIWSKTYDFVGKEDVGTSIEVDEFGNVYVGGFVTQNDNVRNLAVLKYDENGGLLGSQAIPGENLNANAEIRYSEMNNNNECYFIFNEKSKLNIDQCGILKVDTSLTHLWIKKIRDNQNREATDLNISSTGSIYASIAINGSSNANEIVKFSEIVQGNNYYLDDSLVPFCKENELIVRFKGSAIDSSSINDDFADKRIIEFASLAYFLSNEAMTTFERAIEGMCSKAEGNCDIVAVKLFKHLKTYDTIAINRLGDTIKVPDFWSTFLLILPNQMGVEETFNVLNSENDIIAYCEPNLFLEPLSIPNDNYYPGQESLQSDWTYPDADIDIEEAWEVFPEAGLPHIKCGVYDEGINVYHNDFGYDGTNLSTTKVRGGWDFEGNGESIYTTQIPDYGHGTPVAGIIGAIRDNSIGVAGVAGGDYQGYNNFSDKGTSLYALKIMNDDSIINNPIQNVYDAIVSGSIEDTLDYTFGLHTMNNSWRIADSYTQFFTDTNITLLNEATHFANRMNVTFVASRGNEGIMNLAYPAVIDDDWILSVGGSGNDGLRKTKFNGFPQGGSSASSYGLEMDVIAPAVNDMIITTSATTNDYRNFSMTSAAAPHVSGLVTLLQSYLNDTVPVYENLAPEDCENLIEITAVNKNFPGQYTDTVGWGLINAAKALRRVEKPWNAVLHFGTNQYSPHDYSFSQVGNMQTVYIKENVQNFNNTWFLKGDYQVNVFKVEATVNHQLGSTDTIVNYWARPSSSNVFEPIYNDSLLPRERLMINSCTIDTCKMSGYLYEVFDINGNPLGWLPHDTIFPRPKFEYTILAHDSTSPNVGLKQEHLSTNQINLFPNPTSNVQKLVIGDAKNKSIRVKLYDMNGRIISNLFNGKSKNNIFELTYDMSSLSNGFYFYHVYINNDLQQLKSIKY